MCALYPYSNQRCPTTRTNIKTNIYKMEQTTFNGYTCTRFVESENEYQHQRTGDDTTDNKDMNDANQKIMQTLFPNGKLLYNPYNNNIIVFDSNKYFIIDRHCGRCRSCKRYGDCQHKLQQTVDMITREQAEGYCSPFEPHFNQENTKEKKRPDYGWDSKRTIKKLRRKPRESFSVN